MFVIKFPKWKPEADELEIPKVQLSTLANEVRKSAATAQMEILRAGSAEELAIAIAKFRGALGNSATNWSVIAEQTRHWAH